MSDKSRKESIFCMNPCLFLQSFQSFKLCLSVRGHGSIPREKSLASFLRLWFSSINQCQ